MISGNIFLVEERINPSTDFYILPFLSNYSKQIQRCDFKTLPSPKELDGAVVIVVRYLPTTWVQLITQERHRLHSFVFFMDDDLLDISASKTMPLKYRLKLALLASRRKQWLKKQQAKLWVSTPYLQNKYSNWSAKLILPAPITLPVNTRRVFYHGSASHKDEIIWLKPVIEEVLKKDERVQFEIIGDKSVHTLYRKLPRTMIVHPMSWPAYQHFLAIPGRDVGLAPLLDNAFNQSRSYTKFFDISSCRAVGVYASASPYENIVTHKQNGLLVEQDQKAWVKAILHLVDNDDYRQNLLNTALKTLISTDSNASLTDLLNDQNMVHDG